MCPIVDLETYRRLRTLPPADFARRIRLHARSYGCTVAQAEQIGQQAEAAALAGKESRWDILTRSRDLARALAAGTQQQDCAGGVA